MSKNEFSDRKTDRYNIDGVLDLTGTSGIVFYACICKCTSIRIPPCAPYPCFREGSERSEPSASVYKFINSNKNNFILCIYSFSIQQKKNLCIIVSICCTVGKFTKMRYGNVPKLFYVRLKNLRSFCCVMLGRATNIFYLLSSFGSETINFFVDFGLKNLHSCL